MYILIATALPILSDVTKFLPLNRTNRNSNIASYSRIILFTFCSGTPNFCFSLNCGVSTTINGILFHKKPDTAHLTPCFPQNRRFTIATNPLFRLLSLRFPNITRLLPGYERQKRPFQPRGGNSAFLAGKTLGCARNRRHGAGKGEIQPLRFRPQKNHPAIAAFSESFSPLPPQKFRQPSAVLVLSRF